MKYDALSGLTVLRIITRLDRGGSARMVLDLTKKLAEDGVHGVIITGKTTDPETELISIIFRSLSVRYRRSRIYVLFSH